MSGFVLGARVLLAVMFAVAGIAKLADREGSRGALEEFGVTSRLARTGGLVLPLLEVSIAVCLLIAALAWWGLVAATSLLAVFIVVIAVTMARGRAPDCHCFGQIYSAPAGWRTIVRTGALAALGALAVVAGSGADQLSLVGWISELSALEAVAAAAASVLVVVVIAQGWFLMELLRQHGRILRRLDVLERGFADAGLLAGGHAGGPSPSVVGVTTTNGHEAGLTVGSRAPEFELPDLAGGSVSLSDLRARGATVLLVFSDPGCRPCNALLPDIVDWKHRLDDQLTIVLICRGDFARNLAKAHEHELSDVFVEEDLKVSVQYQAYGTPSAVLISVDGRIVSHLAGGSEAIKALVHSAAERRSDVVRSASNPHARARSADTAHSDGPAVGAEAPDIFWRDLDGRVISLRELRGTPVAILFWNPRCGFCQRMVPELRAWEAHHGPGAPRVIVVSTGDQESNRAMGLRSPIALEQEFQSGRAFGATGTPSAVRIDRAGRIAGPIGIGATAVLALLQAPEDQLRNRPGESSAYRAVRASEFARASR